VTVPTVTVDTRALVEAARAGDRAAFGALYAQYHHTVYRFVIGRVHARQTAEDITADTFVKALRNVDRYQHQGVDVGAWLVTIARNLVADHYKCSRTRLQWLVGDWHEDVGTTRRTLMVDADRRNDPAGVAAVNAVSDALDAALTELTSQQRRVLALRFGEGLSVAETAAVLGLREGAVKATQYRACLTLRGLLDGVR
jgi:RNA polymerase sigma-70 factor (ECF subfamily)